MSSGAYTDLIVDNLYFNNGGSGITSFTSLPVHVNIPPTNFGYSPNNPAFTNNFYFNYYPGGQPYFQQATTPPTAITPIYGVPTGSDNYGTVLTALPQGTYNVTVQTGSTPANGILTVTLTLNGTVYSTTNIDCYDAAIGSINALVSTIPLTVPAGNPFNTLAITLTCTGQNVASTGYYMNLLTLNIDSLNTTVM